MLPVFVFDPLLLEKIDKFPMQIDSLFFQLLQLFGVSCVFYLFDHFNILFSSLIQIIRHGSA